MQHDQFSEKLKEATRCTLRYATDFYGAKDFDKLFQLKPKEFINKCYEGYKIAQKVIVDSLLSIEHDLQVKQKEIADLEKGKHRKALRQDPVHKKLQAQAADLRIQHAAFQEVANSIVWTVLLQERTHIKSFLRPGGGSGYLRDRNIASLVAAADHYNKDPNTFTLICDITSCLHIGDLLTVGSGSLVITEVKEDTPVNNLVSKIVHGSLEKMKVDTDSMKALHIASPKHGLKQVQRYFNQVRSFVAAKEYIQTDEGIDNHFNVPKKAITIFTEDKNYSEMVNMGLDELHKSDKAAYFILPFDCCIVGLFKRVEGESRFVRRMNFRHHLYHWLKEPYEKCQYTDPSKMESLKEGGPEFIKYYKFEIFSFREKLFHPTHPPIFFVLKEEHAIDLLAEKIDIYIYFDHERFVKMCEERGLKTKWLFARDLKKDGHFDPTSYLPKFGGKFLEITDASGKSGSTLGYGLFYRMIFEFQWGYNLIEQFRENIWIDSHPKLNVIRTRVRLWIRHAQMKYYVRRKYFAARIKRWWRIYLIAQD